MAPITVTPVVTYKMENRYLLCPGCGHGCAGKNEIASIGMGIGAIVDPGLELAR